MYRKDIRFSKYSPLLMSLPPGGLFSPSSIADYAISSGLLSIIHPKEDDKLARQRIRIALGLYSRNHKFPRESDSLRLTRSRVFREWFGWRWQRFSSLDEGHAALSGRVHPVIQQLKVESSYAISELFTLWKEQPLELPAYAYRRGRPGWKRQWQELNEVLIQLSFRNYAMGLGLDPEVPHPAKSWHA